MKTNTVPADTGMAWDKTIKNNDMQKFLIITGLLIILAGLFWPWLHKIPLGRLPGDIVVSKPGFSFYFPITTSIIISIAIAIILKIFK